MSVADKMVVTHQALSDAGIPHAFGGALALAWCTGQARGTVDVDVNVFVAPERAPEVLAALPPEISWTEDDVAVISRDGQTRLRWDATPIDLFFNTTDFHERASARTRWEPFQGDELPFLECSDLAVFKVFFNRTRDWADLEEMREAGTLDVESVLGAVTHYLGPDDERVNRLRELR